MPLTKVQSRGTENVGQGSSNVIINGAMNIAQRSTSETNRGDDTGYYVVDRWKLSTGASTAGRLTLSQDSSAPSGFANSAKFNCTTADTSIASGEFLQFEQLIEGQNLQAFAKGTADAKPFAVSFYVKGNASATYVCELFDADNSRQISKTFNVTTDWTRVELNFPADTTGTFDDDNASSLALVIHLNAGSNYTSGTINSGSWASSTNANRVGSGTTSFFDSTDRKFFITGVQLEVGSQASDFQHEDIVTTLAKCQRYFHKITSLLYGGYGADSAGDYSTIWFPTELRATPTMTGVNSGSTMQNVTKEFAQVYYVGGYSAWSSGATASAEL
tara:strand:+ start:1097 stop:2089 length:993 start_codon:yes stop_codon:yes gene_type:complete